MTLKKPVIRKVNRYGLPLGGCPFCGSSLPGGNVEVKNSSLAGAASSPDTDNPSPGRVVEAFGLYEATLAHLPRQGKVDFEEEKVTR